jgi:hypothetical protein
MLSYEQVASAIKSVGFSADAEKYYKVSRAVEAEVRKQFGVNDE